jgi:hypothetical protein
MRRCVMQRPRERLIAVAVVGALAITGMFMNSRQTKADGSAPVTIVGPLPLPVTGSTTLSGTVAATQSGLWNVGITGNTNATPLWVTDRDNPARHPFMLSGRLLPGNVNLNLGSAPAGQRYVIEHYTSICFVATTDTLFDVEFGIFNVAFDSAVPHMIVPGAGGVPGEWVATGNTRLYGDPNGNIFFLVNATGSVDCSVSVTGYSVSLP